MTSLITGITGQDGSYLAELLIGSGHRIAGTIAPSETELPGYFGDISTHDLVSLEVCDLGDPASFRNYLRKLKPEAVYHLGALSSPAACAQMPDLSRAVNVTSLEVLLDWVKRDSPSTRVLAVSSAAVFGNPEESPQNELTPENPVNEYGRQKSAVREISRQARDEGIFVATAIPFNHESERRPEDFVIAKIVWSAARIKFGLEQRLELGDVTPRRDWGYAPEYVQAYNWMLEIEQPQELILATGQCHSVKEAVELAFSAAGVSLDCYESNLALKPAGDPQDSVGDPKRAWLELGWEATTAFESLIPKLVDYALNRLSDR